MKWMLVAVVYGLGPIQTNLVYDQIEDCAQAMYVTRAEWAKVLSAGAKITGAGVTDAAVAQVPQVTCIPYRTPNSK